MGLKFRRGTNAQKSGSLAFGEPYVNTDLNTLMVGGASGDITLATSVAAGAYATTGSNTFVGDQAITGSLGVTGNLTLGGNITIGDNTSDTLAVTANLSSSLIPQTTNVFDIGSSSKIYRNIFGGTISGSVLEIMSGSNPELRLINKTTGIAYHLNNGDSGNLHIHNATANNLLVRFVSASSAAGGQDIQFFGNLSVSKSISSPTITGLNVFTASNGNTSLNEFTASENTKSNTLALYTASLNTFTASENTKSETLRLYTASVDTKFSTLQTLTASMAAQVSRLQESTASLNLYTSSNDTTNTTQNTRLSRLEESTASLNAFSASQLVKDSTLQTYTTSIDTKFSTLATYTSSNDTTNTTQNTRLSRLEEATSSLNSLTGSYARTNTANVFNGNQTITGSLFISQDLIVQGSSSIQTISSSRLDIGDNIVQLNVNSPALRFGGLAIVDSGSAGSSGSFLYDSVEDEFIFVHRGNGTNVTSSHFITGPETYDNLGNETYLTINRLPKATGKEHIVDSNITDTGALITLGSNTVVNGTLVASGTSLVSSSAQVNYTQLSGISANIISASTDSSNVDFIISGGSITANLFGGVVSGSAQVVGILTSLNEFSASENTKAATLATFTSSLATTYEGRATAAKTIFSGSSQVDHNATTNYVANRHIDHTVVSISAGNGLTGGGDISATRTLTLDTTSATFTTGVTTQNNALGVVSGSRTISGITLGSNLGTLTISTGLSGTSYNGSTGVTIANTGVLSITSNTGLSSNVSATGNVTITNTGVTSNVAGTGISLSGGTGAVTITNSGVTSLTAGTGVSVSGATGGVTVSIGQAVATSSNVQFNSLGIGMAASATAGRIDATNDIVAYSSSDIRFKENIKPIENALQKISKISGNTYDWKAENKIEHGYEGNDVGVIAQEIEEVLPQLVQTRDNGYKAVKYDKLVALLIEGIKEQQTQIHSLTIEIEKLKESKGL